MKLARLVLTMVVGALAAQGPAFAQSTAPPPAGATADITPTEEAPAASPWGWVKMPKITMPKIEMPKMPADPLAPIKNSAKKVGDGTKKAWEGTKELFTFGGSKTEQPTHRVATQVEPPSMWQRMFGGAKEQEKQGPQTVAEWMSQKRLDP